MMPFPRMSKLEREVTLAAFGIGAGIFTFGAALGVLLWSKIKGD